MPEPTLIALNRVRADRADVFEDWLRTVVVPATRHQRPQLDGQWRVLRAVEPEDGAVVFAFVCEGGAPEDWQLRPILEQELGGAAADRALAQFDAMLEEEQSGWFFTTVTLDR